MSIKKALFGGCSVVFAAALIAGCGGAKSDSSGKAAGGSELKTAPAAPAVAMTTAKDTVKISVAGSGEASIDWGDGTVENITLAAEWADSVEWSEILDFGGSAKNIPVYTRVYSGAPAPRTITITGAGITQLRCCENGLTNLDVSQITALTYLCCRINNLTVLNVTNNAALAFLDCNVNQLTKLDVGNNAALTKLTFRGNQVARLDVGKNTALTELQCGANLLASVDVSQNKALVKFDCSESRLTSLDVSNNTALTWLTCNGNNLTSLDVSKNIPLVTLDCSDNKLTALDVSKNTVLASLDCDNNKLTALALNALFGTLHGNPIKGSELPMPYTKSKLVTIGGNPGTFDGNIEWSIVSEKGWSVMTGEEGAY